MGDAQGVGSIDPSSHPQPKLWQWVTLLWASMSPSVRRMSYSLFSYMRMKGRLIVLPLRVAEGSQPSHRRILSISLYVADGQGLMGFQGLMGSPRDPGMTQLLPGLLASSFHHSQWRSQEPL